jgi:pimeloyl-ACP methyl ester carboxylesterase
MKRIIEDKNGNVLSYAEYGDRNGFPILIQHGLIASIEDYDLFDRLLHLKTRLICIARPGYGESTPYLLGSYAEWAEILMPLILDLDLPRFDVLGMSSGAPYAYAIPWRFPQAARNIYIFSGLPALYDEIVLSQWPFPAIRDQEISDLENLAKDLFFSWVKPDDLKKNDVRDSMMNNCFGVAQDLRLRFMDWGFFLDKIDHKVFMQHSKTDDSVPYGTAVRTSQLLPHCTLELSETGPHFSPEALDEFFKETVARNLP